MVFVTSFTALATGYGPATNEVRIRCADKGDAIRRRTTDAKENFLVLYAVTNTFRFALETATSKGQLRTRQEKCPHFSQYIRQFKSLTV